MNLTLALNANYFNEIKARTKTEEFRLVNQFWKKRLIGRSFDNLIITSGYPKWTETDRWISLPWRGYTIKKITHPHFGPEEVEVFAIKLTDYEEDEPVLIMSESGMPMLESMRQELQDLQSKSTIVASAPRDEQ